ncbi:MAG TPA: phosphopantetheine-binding protein [Pyrinomonadaceae bacterium]|nr:phosphopantetheine-binding protein [Pyrinomonadaceae bacterium]
MPETVDFQKAVEALSPRQREVLASRLNSHAVEHERLLAYVVPKSNQHLSVAELRQFLQEQLPDYMVPADFIVLDEWPRTASGKIDLQALSSPPEAPSQNKTAHTPPQNELEELIAGFWREVLYVDEIDREDNFFDLGGHSLLLMKVNLKLKHHCGKEISLVEMFKYPTVSTLAEFLSGQQNGASSGSLQKIQERAANRRETSKQQRARRLKYRAHRGV